MPPGLFAGERGLVTGSASNIGRGIALAPAREGARLLLVDINAEANAAVAGEIAAAGGEAQTLTCDLSERDGWRAVLRAVAHDVPHMFVHSACPRRLESDTPLAVSEETWDAMLTTNVRSGFFLGRELGRRMKGARGIEPADGGP